MRLNRNQTRVFNGVIASIYSVSENGYFLVQGGYFNLYGYSEEYTGNICTYRVRTKAPDSKVYTCILHHFQGWLKSLNKQYLDIDLTKGCIWNGQNRYTVNTSTAAVHYPPVFPESTNVISQCTTQLNRLLIILSLSSPVTTIEAEAGKRDILTASTSTSCLGLLRRAAISG